MLLRQGHEDIFPDFVIRHAQDFGVDVLIIPDLRFPNEWDIISKADGFKILVDSGDRIERTDKHISENSLSHDLEWDFKLQNSGELGLLNHNVIKMYTELCGED